MTGRKKVLRRVHRISLNVSHYLSHISCFIQKKGLTYFLIKLLVISINLRLWCTSLITLTTKRDTPSHMHNRSFAPQTVASVSSSTAPRQAPSSVKDDLSRIFNTALVSTQAGTKRDFAAELYELTESASFKAILSAVRQLSRVQGMTERQAAEQVIQTFRKMDEVWSEYLFREGVDRIRQPRS